MLRSLKARHPIVFGAVVGVVLASASAALAFVILALTVSGSGNGGFSSATTQSAVTAAQNGTTPNLDAGQTVADPITLTNQDTSGSAHTVQTITGTFTTK